MLILNEHFYYKKIKGMSTIGYEWVVMTNVTRHVIGIGNMWKGDGWLSEKLNFYGRSPRFLGFLRKISIHE